MTQSLNYGTAGVRPPRRGLTMWLLMIALAIFLFLAFRQKSPGTVAVPLILAFIWFFVFRQLRRNSVQPKQPIPVIIVNPERA